MNLKKLSARLQKVRGDEWPYRFHEGQKALSDYVFGRRLKSWTPPQRIPIWPISLELSAWRTALHQAAQTILSGEGELLGVRWDTEKPWGWDARYEWQWSLSCNPIAQLRGGPPGADVKFICEVFRLDGLLTLALAGHAGHREAYEKALSLWRTLLQEHQAFKGILYLFGIESAFRVVKCLMLNQIFAADYTSTDIMLVWRFLYGQQQWIRRYPSLFSSGNNHRISELSGLAIIEAIAPELPDSQPQAIAHELLTHLQGLMHADGIYAEQSLYYQSTIMEWILLVSSVLKHTGVYFPIQPILGYLSNHINSMLGEVGEAPLIGDLDDSHILPMLGAKNYIHSVAQSVSAQLNVSVPFQPQADLRLSMLGLTAPIQRPFGLQKHFEHGGITQLTKGDVRVLIDHGALGYERLAAHGHADALSLWAFKGQQVIWTDFGSYSYSDAEWREWARCTAAHNTIELNHQSSSVMLGGFGWRTRALSFILDYGEAHVQVAHDGYEARFGVRHVRQVELLETGIRVIDTLEGKGRHHVRMSYLLGRGLNLDPDSAHQIIDADGRQVMSFEMNDETFLFQHCYGDESKEGWLSTGYMRKQPACRLIWSAQVELPKRIEIFWRWS